MATVINNPSGTTNDNFVGYAIGIVLLVAIVLLLFFYGLPILRQVSAPPQINVPDEIDINLNQPK